jgi:gamma-glutamyltranspeptidase
MPDIIFVESTVPDPIRAALRAKGHTVIDRNRKQGHANTIALDLERSEWIGVADPRRGGHVAAQ